MKKLLSILLASALFVSLFSVMNVSAETDLLSTQVSMGDTFETQGDITNLCRSVDVARSAVNNKDKYTSESYNTFYEIYLKAYELCIIGDDNQEKIDNQQKELDDAMANLVFKEEYAIENQFYTYANLPISNEFRFFYVIKETDDYILCSGGSEKASDIRYSVIIGDYEILSRGQQYPYDLALFIYKDGQFYQLEDAYKSGIINMDDVASYLTKYGYEDISSAVKEICKVDGYTLYCKGQSEYASEKKQTYTVGNYTINVNKLVGSENTLERTLTDIMGLYLTDNSGNKIDLQKAFNENLLSISEVEQIVNTLKNMKYIEVERSNITDPTYKTLVKYLMEYYGYGDESELEIELYKKLSDKLVLFKVYSSIDDCTVHEDYIGKYNYVYTSSQEAHIFDGKKIYSIKDAYNKDITTNKQLDKIATILKRMKVTKLSIKAGETDYLNTPCDESGNIGKTSFSKDKIASIKTYGIITGLKKGTTTITVKPLTGKKFFCKIVVTSNPKLKIKNKTISSKKTYTVKKGKTLSVKISGKAKNIKNKYIGTKYAKVISKTSASKIKIKGITGGTTTVKVKVNGVKTLKIKVKVI